MLTPLPDDELSLVSGGMTNAEHPGVQAALKAFYGVLFCGGTSKLRRQPSPSQTARSARPAADPFQIAHPPKAGRRHYRWLACVLEHRRAKRRTICSAPAGRPQEPDRGVLPGGDSRAPERLLKSGHGWTQFHRRTAQRDLCHGKSRV